MIAQILQALPHGVLVVDADGRVLTANTKASDLLAAPAEGRRADELLEAVPAPGQEGEIPLVGRWIRVSATVLPGSDAGRTLLTLTDVTARRVAEQQRDRAQDRMRMAFEDAPVGMVILSVDAEHGGRVLEVNQAVCDLLGYTAEELVGMTVQEVTHPDDVEEGGRLTRELIEGGGRVYHREKRFLHKDGSVVWTVVSSTVARDAQGRPIYGIGQVVDITELKRAAEERSRMQAELDRAHRLESIGQLAGGIAHDFNNLLAIVLNYATFVSEGLEEGGRLRGDVEEIRRAAERGTELTQRLLVFTRQDLGAPEPVDAAELLGQVGALLRRTIGEHIAIGTVAEPGLPHLLSDPAGLQQVLVNLAVNARDAMPGGGELRLIGRRAGAGHVALEVADTGTGMPPEVLARAFEPFFTTKPVGQGTGLGLATSYALVRRSGGEIEIDSDPGRGTVVRLLLPVAGRPAEAAPPEPAAGDTGLAGAVMLVVEDDDRLRKVVCRILTSAGCEVVATGDPTTAAALAREHAGRLDALLTDMVMPGLGGVQVAEAVRAVLPALPAVFMSGSLADTDALPDGTPIVAKPFGRTELVGALAGALGRAPVSA